MAGVMVTLSVNRLKGAITPQILNPCVEIDQEVYTESLQDHISHHIEAAYDTESERKMDMGEYAPVLMLRAKCEFYLDRYPSGIRRVRFFS